VVYPFKRELHFLKRLLPIQFLTIANCEGTSTMLNRIAERTSVPFVLFRINCKKSLIDRQTLPHNLNHSSKTINLNLHHCKLRYRFYENRVGKSGQHRAPHPANGWTVCNNKHETVPQKITAIAFACVHTNKTGKGENVR